jgi:type II secretory pathway pseudopilin PulG
VTRKHVNARAPRLIAFTLVELLVVVTIIVALLALLVPAMSKAVYQGQLAQCGAKLKAAATGVTTYALASRRYYPDRGLARFGPYSNTAAPDRVAWSFNPMALAFPQDGSDMRPGLRTVFDINKVLQCPFTVEMDLEDGPGPEDDDVNAEASYVMFWGWRYVTGNITTVNADTDAAEVEINETAGIRENRGMYKVGDQFTWGGRAFSVLAGDIDLRYPESSQASHPDLDLNRMALVAGQDEVIFGFRGTVSRWIYRADRRRGHIDSNFVFDDGSVQRYQRIKNLIPPEVTYNTRDMRFDWTPLQFDNRRGSDRLQIPMR